MTITHAEPGDVVDVEPYGPSMAEKKTATLFKTDHVELIRLVMSSGKVIPEHQAPGEIIVQCLEGRIEFTAQGKTVELGPGQLLYLEAKKPHAVRCIQEASFLVTKLSGR